jgi:tetratricopeptide (TPR) repeat protein
MITWVLLLALSPVQAYNQGNALYAAKDYAGAARAYEEALRAGPSAAVLHNLGNALFKRGQVGRAILSYRRARYLAPRDGDVAGNLEFARRYRVDKLLAASSPIALALDAAFHRLSRREAGLLAAICFTLAAACLAVWIVRRSGALLAVASLLGLAFAFGFVTQQTWKAEVDGRPAVVVVPEVHALSGPSDDAQQILLLHDGTEVRIREARGSYLLVQLPGGNGGWVRGDAIERVYAG